MKVTPGLLIFLLFCPKCTSNIVDASTSGRIVRFFCKRRIFRRMRICQRIPCLDNIQTALDMALAFEQATTDLSGPATLIEICTERIIVPATDSEKISISARTNVNGDQFGFTIQFKQIDLRCAIKTETDPKGRCVLEASDGVGLFYLNNATLNVTGFNLVNGGNVNHNSGGAMHISNSSTVNLTDMAFTNNEAVRGGAIYSNSTETKPKNRIIFNGANSTRQIGTNYNIEFIGNRAWSGGAIDASNTVITGSHVKFQQNIATRFAGGIHFNRGSDSVIKDSFFYNNYVAGDGGAVYAREEGVATFDTTKFHRNAARLQSGAIDVPGRHRVVLSYCEIYANVVNVSRRTLFDDYDKVQKPEDLYVIGSLENASAVRSLSVGGILSINTTFSDNTRLPLNTIANLYVDGNGTAICKGTSFCGDRGLANTCDSKDVCTNCNQDDFSTIIEPGKGNCLFNETAPPTFTSLTLAPTFKAPTKAPVTAPVKAPMKAPMKAPITAPVTAPVKAPVKSPGGIKCFEDGDELRNAVGIYIDLDPDGTVKSTYGDPIGSWCVGKVTNMSYMFFDAPYFNEDISNWDVSSVEDMTFMFDFATSFNGDISNWDVSSVKDMRRMFHSTTSFNGDISNWNVSSVTNMNTMFFNANSFNGDISNWNVSPVTNMGGMFFAATSFNGDISNWNVSSVTDMDSMFRSATSFNGDISEWNVSSVRSMSDMFSRANSFNGDISNWNVSSVTDMDFMFEEASAFNQNLCAWGANYVQAPFHARMFVGSNCPIMADPDYSQSPPGPFCHICL